MKYLVPTAGKMLTVDEELRVGLEAAAALTVTVDGAGTPAGDM
jgi:hypothetical protein